MRHSVALITGGTGRLGPAVIRAFLKEQGCYVVSTYIVDEQADRTHAMFSNVQERLKLEKVDVRDSTAVEKLVRDTTVGYGQIDYLINLVGARSSGMTIWETSDADFDRMLDTNLRTTFVCCRAIVPGMIERNFGRIVNVSSRNARLVEPRAGVHAVSKMGVIGLTEALSAELQDYDVNVNCVIPDVIDTPSSRSSMPGANFDKWVRPQQLALIIRWLTSPDATPINGAAIPVYRRL